MTQGALVWIEQFKGQPAAASWEALGAARALVPDGPVIAAIFGLLALMFLAAPLESAAAPAQHTIHLDARQFEFEPGRVRVNRGDRVTIRLTASDVVHGFYLDSYGLEQRVEPGVAREVTFVADQAGKFHYRCSARTLTRQQSARLAAVLPSPLRRRPGRMSRYSATIEERMRAYGW